MRISTSLDLAVQIDGVSWRESARMMKQAGFTGVDFSLCRDQETPEKQLAPAWIEDVRLRAASLKAEGLEIAQTQLAPDDLIALADQDDIWLPAKLETLEKAFETPDKGGTKPALVFGDAQTIDARGNIIDKSWRALAHIRTDLSIKAHIAGTNNVTGCLSLFRASLLPIIVPIPQGVGVHDAWISLVAMKQGGVTAINTPIAQYRLHDNNSVGLGNRFNFDETCERQIAWTKLLEDQSHTIPLDAEELDFTRRLNHYWTKRSKKALLLEELPFLIKNKAFLFPDSRTRNRKILFSLLGAPMVHLLFGKDK